MVNEAKKQTRPRLSQHITEILISFFERTPKPTPDQKEALAQQAGITSRSVQIWFQNKRAKLKREMREMKNFIYNKNVIFPLLNSLLIPKLDLRSRRPFCEEDLNILSFLKYKKNYKFHDCTITCNRAVFKPIVEDKVAKLSSKTKLCKPSKSLSR
ncbi:hypothetical protein VCUG_00287 [Vavraia culicis subsp. floridensis]|uniref:Homeobox domain-containing protein n=1 Tax=Vavraia culicis (isolate floridensis) TaxID=948595 RepID=L2GX38_VAVCU|nr:uncharacterized protein VCUG_00287 [Vavraia culicis subsp. floridensis]ELA48246.1 hypothetical protein VCUG_00287 [Vavraia culicis subsp. floridensis]